MQSSALNPKNLIKLLERYRVMQNNVSAHLR